MQVMMPLLPELLSFAISISAIFEWNVGMLRRTMEMVRAKKPQVIIVCTDGLLPPYLAIYCPLEDRHSFFFFIADVKRLTRLFKVTQRFKKEGKFDPIMPL